MHPAPIRVVSNCVHTHATHDTLSCTRKVHKLARCHIDKRKKEKEHLCREKRFRRKGSICLRSEAIKKRTLRLSPLLERSVGTSCNTPPHTKRKLKGATERSSKMPPVCIRKSVSFQRGTESAPHNLNKPTCNMLPTLHYSEGKLFSEREEGISCRNGCSHFLCVAGFSSRKRRKEGTKVKREAPFA